MKYFLLITSLLIFPFTLFASQDDLSKSKKATQDVTVQLMPSPATDKTEATRTVNVVIPQLVSLALKSNVTSLNLGEKAALTVTGTYEDNTTKALTSNIEWSISSEGSVEINGIMLTVLKDINTTLQAKVGSILSNSLNLELYWEVDSHRLPPEPDPAVNNSTLLGIDINDNGVRDDVERWIYETYDEYVPCHQEPYDVVLDDGSIFKAGREVCEENAIPYHPIVRAIAMQGARAAQIIIQEPEKAKETMKYFDNAQDCGMYIGKNIKRIIDGEEYKLFKDDPISESEGMIAQLFNTIMRARAYGKYNFYLSGGVYSVPTDEEGLTLCDDNVKELLKELK